MWIRRYLGSIVTVLLLVIAALSVPWLTARRPLSSELQADRTISVVASGDSGAGTLREALFTAAQDPERVRIIIHPRQIRLRTPLPPVLGAKGVVIDAMSSRCELDGAGVAGGPLLEILSPATTVAGLGLKNAREEGIVIRANNVLLRGMTLTKCGDGVSVAGTSEQISIEDSTFVENTSGLRISPESRGVVVRNNEFQRNEQAGIWASAAAPETGSERPIIIQRNRFEADRISIALINVAGLIQSNEIRLNREIGIYLLGSPAIARSNTIHGGAIGILTDSAHGAIVELNQIDRTTQVALLVRDSRGLAVTRNRVYSNAFGLAVIFGDPASPAVLSDNLVLANTLDGIYVVGASPLIRGNEVIQNGAAAVRILDFVPWNAPRVPARPRLEANTFRANLINDAIRGEYRPPEDKE